MKYTTLFVMLIVALSAGFALAADEPVQKWVAGSEIKAVGQPWCDGTQEHQMMAVMASMKDASGADSEKELAKWDQLTGKTCSDAPKTRGKMPDKPNAKTAEEARQKVMGEQNKAKSRGGCSWRAEYYVYWDYGTYLYIEWYDNCGNFVAYEYRY